MRPDECRIRARGNIRDDGSFSFWDDGRPLLQEAFGKRFTDQEMRVLNALIKGL